MLGKVHDRHILKLSPLVAAGIVHSIDIEIEHAEGMPELERVDSGSLCPRHEVTYHHISTSVNLICHLICHLIV